MFDAPPFADRATTTVNFEELEHPVKSIVTGTVEDAFAGMSPSESGNEGLLIEGVHFGPEDCVSVKLSI